MPRYWELDALRGLMLVLMTLTHVPTRWADTMGQPLGYVSAAEGFVLLSACMSGLVYVRRLRESGPQALRQAMWRRALAIYAVHACGLLFLFSAVYLLGEYLQQPAVTNLMSFYNHRPVLALYSGLALIYKPPLLDILPMYVFFMLLSPAVMVWGERRGWRGPLSLSLVLWLAAQGAALRAVYDTLTQALGIEVPFREAGCFDAMAWQLMWMLGLWTGAQAASPSGAVPLGAAWPRWMVGVALVVACGGWMWRHEIGQVPFAHDPSWAATLDKWELGPLRVLNFLAWWVLLMRFGPACRSWLPRLGWLELLGRSSLQVFLAHQLIVLVALGVLGEIDPARPWWQDAVLLASTFVILTLVAHYHDRSSLRRQPVLVATLRASPALGYR